MRKFTPLPPRTFKSLVSPWAKVINDLESGSIINLSARSQLYRVQQFIQDRRLLKSLVPSGYQINFILLNLLSEPLDKPTELKHFLDSKIARHPKRTVILILDADKLFDEKVELLGYLNQLPLQNRSLSLLFFFQKNITLPKYMKIYAKYAALYQNIIITPLYDQKSIQHYIHYEASLYGITIPDQTITLIAQKCGGRMWLAKQAVRYFKRIGDQRNLFSHAEIQLRLEQIYQEFEPEEQVVLSKITRGMADFEADERLIINYFLKTRLVAKKYRSFCLTIPLLTEYIRQETNKMQLALFNDRAITVNRVVVDRFFSSRERRVLIYFLKHTHCLIDRFELANLIWQQQRENQYTDWALDMFINRLRRKLNQIGLNARMLKTVRNRGFQFRTQV